MEISNENFRSLQGYDESVGYLNHLRFALGKLHDFFSVRAEQRSGYHYESAVAADFLSKLLYTVDALKMKYAYNRKRNLRVDPHESGFPRFFDVDLLETDLRRKKKKLEDLPGVQSIKQEVLDFMFKYKTDPEELLSRLSERSYYEMLDSDRLFLPFTPSTSLRRNKKRKEENFRSYTYSWGCYDFLTNRPSIHIIMFDQDTASAPLEEGGANYKTFIDMIRAEGSRKPSIGILAMGIDSNLSDIHPKAVKRISIGPLCAENFSRNPEDLFRLLEARRKREEDFILLFEEEVILSSDQQVSRSLFSFGQVRETFYIPETDIECYERKASKIYKYMMLPHHVLQHIDLRGRHSAYKDYDIITYTKRGGIYVN